ncbi:MAG TPA: hypothetical protein DCR03_00260 [Gammaproteobacteria bacterium]|nr:hypothetical protein [Gammaproteobacteria bacterium]
MEKKQQFIGALVGCAIGDALGAPIEGWTREKILGLDGLTERYRQVHHKNRNIHFPMGQYTDDTQLTLAIVRGILDYGEVDGGAIAAQFVKLWESKEIVGAGVVATNAVQRLIRGIPWNEAALSDDEPWNGAAMRIAPIGVWNHDRPERMKGDVFTTSVITHRHPQAISGALAIAGAVSFVVTHEKFSANELLTAIADIVVTSDRELAEHVLLISDWIALPEIEALHCLDALMSEESNLSRDGWFGVPVMTEPTVLMALYAFIRSPNDFTQTVETALCAGGDVDTTAAIAGAISGAYNGVSALPRSLALTVLNSEEIHRLGEQFYRLWMKR